MSKNFVVYKSSAGSGKTTTLVKEYLKLALKNPERFRQILAITFTNKAANEMKARILENLKQLASGTLNRNDHWELMKEMRMSEEEIVRRAAILLQNITHAYDEFAVSTIDSFVHQIVRTFSTDLKLPQGFEVLIDKDDIIPYIVEEMYDKLGTDRNFTEILLQFVLSQVEDEKSYDLNKNLSEFVEKQLSEPGTGDTGQPEKLTPAQFLETIQKIRHTLSLWKKEIIDHASKGLETIENAGLTTDDFRGKTKSGVGGYFLKLKKWEAKPADLIPKGDTLKALDEDDWFPKSLAKGKKETILRVAPELKNHLEAIRSLMNRYLFWHLANKNIYEMALIGEIRHLFEDFTVRTQKVHISEFNKRIHEEISGQPVPFIYERLGRRYRHFLIDEFQDTSVLQWDNLLPLIEESLANGQFNMLVGDAKQAIYRFRHGEVELFTHLPRLFGVEDNETNRQRQQVLEQHFEQKDLRFNYRSREQIIGFNNDFFRWAGKQLEAGFDAVYHDVEQQLPRDPKTGGLVSVDFVQGNNADDFRSKRLEKIRDIVLDLRQKKYPLNDICILTLKNDSASEIAAFLLQDNIPVVTSESLLLTTSPSVRLTIAVMKLLLDSGNLLIFAEFLINWLQIQGREDAFHALYTEAATQENPAAYILKKWGLQLPHKTLLRRRSVYEMTVEIIRHLIPGGKPDPFLLFFLDFIFDKEPVCYGSLPAFLKLWEEKKDKLSIVFPEGIDAVQIMTAHKAKGLKFGTVIADLHHMRFRLTRDQYWEKADTGVSGNLSSVLLNINKNDLAAIGRQAVYDYEKAKTDLDFLNVVYVAFTRPVDALFVIGSRLPKGGDNFSKKLDDYLEYKQIRDEEKLHYEWGAFPAHASDNPPATVAETLSANYTTPWYDFMEIAPVDEVGWESAGESTPRTYGKIVHAVLSGIRHAEDAEVQINGWLYSGLLNPQDTEHIRQMVQTVVRHPQLSEYFTRDAVIKTETELFDRETRSFKRPDRVVLKNGRITILDYKTGRRETDTEKKYRKQVAGYAELYRRLGFKNIVKKLVYLSDTGIEVVEI
jgi:ATP-dependent exoDNAse (exonuclease V) beta subunit